MTDSLQIVTDSHSLEILEAIKDSLTLVVPHIVEMAENSKPEPYIVQNITLASWNLVTAIVAAIFGFLGALFGYLGYKFSKKTAHNVVRVSAEVQQQLCLDFIIDLYRNTMSAVKYGQACKDGKTLQVNDIVALRLLDFDDIFHIDVYNRNSDVYIRMKHLKDRMKNYNDDVQLCCDNIINGRVSNVDFQHLSFKPMHMLVMVRWLMDHMEGQNGSIDRIVEFLVKKHVKHITGNDEYLLSLSDPIVDNRYYKYICGHKRLLKRVDILFDKADLSLANCLYSDSVSEPEIVGRYYEIINKLPGMLEYVTIMSKKEWNGQDLRTLLLYMIVIDIVIDCRPSNEA